MAQVEQKKVNNKVLKQNTSLLMLNDKLVKDLEGLKAHASYLQSTTEALHADLAVATASKLVIELKRKQQTAKPKNIRVKTTN